MKILRHRIQETRIKTEQEKEQICVKKPHKHVPSSAMGSREAIHLKMNLKAIGDFVGIVILSFEFEGREDGKG